MTTPPINPRRKQAADLAARGPVLYLVLLTGSLLLVVIFLRVNLFFNPGLRVPGFPLDDGYIYSNYVLHAAEGHFFQYNPGEYSGGVTSLLWYLLQIPLYLLLRLFNNDPLWLAVAPSYLLAVPLLALVGWLTWRLTGLVSQPLLPRTARLLPTLTTLAVLLNPQIIWAALSGLELPLSLMLVLLTCDLFLRDLRDLSYEGAWPGVMVTALLPWARPELVIVGGVLLLIVVGGAAQRRWGWRGPLRLGVGLAVGFGAMALTYWLGYGRPLPSSFYAKVRAAGLRKLPQATVQLWQDGQWLTVLLFGGVAVSGVVALGIASWQRLRPQPTPLRKVKVEQPHTLALFAAIVVAYYVALSFSLAWFGQENRYLLPMLPLVTLVVIGRTALSISLIKSNLKLPARLVQVAVVTIALAGGWQAREWAASRYAVEAGNIYAAQMQPALWLATNSPTGTLVATEPVGAVGLLSGKPLADVVGLTTTPLLGHYKDWSYIWPYLRARNASYLLYYPPWLKRELGGIPAWLIPVQEYAVENNLVAGDKVITIYRFDWSKYPGK